MKDLKTLKSKTILIDETNESLFVSLILHIKTKKEETFEELNEYQVKNKRVLLNLPKSSFKKLAIAIVNYYNERKKPTEYKKELIGVYIKQSRTFYTKS